MTKRYKIRAAVVEDIHFLWEMLYQALYIPEGEERPSREILNHPEIASILRGWGREGDHALVAVSGNQLLGAVWIRLYDSDNPTYGYIDEQTPVLGMAIQPNDRGQGIGTQLLEQMLKKAQEEGFLSISLSVDPRNQALSLYKKLGFVKVGESGTSWDMQIKLAE